MALEAYQGLVPRVDPSAWVAAGALVIGAVTLAAEASIWPGCVLRGDIAPITIGERSNIQDLSVVHVDTDLPTEIGADVTVGHRAILHACTVGDGTLIGMGAIVLNGAVIGAGCLIAAGALVPPGKVIPDGSVVMGMPGKVVRRLSPEEIAGQREHAARYAVLARSYRQ